MAVITLTGTPGSGKSTLAKLLAERLGYTHYSIGDVRRDYATKRGITLAELNRLGEGEEDTDTQFDEYQRRLGETEDDFVIDCRLGFHFIPRSVKLFVDADEQVRAQRLMQRDSVGEQAAHVDEAMRLNKERLESDRRRYVRLYGVDPFSMTNYDLVLDTTNKRPEPLVEEVLEKFKLEPKK